eukprot:g66844.t1
MPKRSKRSNTRQRAYVKPPRKRYHLNSTPVARKQREFACGAFWFLFASEFALIAPFLSLKDFQCLFNAFAGTSFFERKPHSLGAQLWSSYLLCSNIRMPLVYFVEGHTWKTIVRDTLAYMLGESSIVNGLWPTDWPCARCLRRRAVTWGIPLYHYCHVCLRNERSHLVADLEAIRKSFVLNILQVDLELLDVIRSWWDVSYPQEFLQVIQTMDLAFTYKGTGWKRVLFVPIQQGLLVWGLFQTNLAPHVRQNQDRITAERYQMSEKHFQLLQGNLKKTEAFLNQAREASVLGNEEMVPCGLQLQHMLPTGGFLAGP